MVNILNNPKAKVPLRIERLTLRLQGYEFDLKHISSEQNISDYSSRHPFDTCATKNNENEKYVNFVSKFACPNAITLDEIKHETKRDEMLQNLAKLVRTGEWYKLDKPEQYSEFKKADTKTLKYYRRLQNELTVSANNNLLLKGHRIILPQYYHKIAVTLAHRGHQGIEKTKTLLRSKVFFLNMDQQIEDAIRHCIPCQAVSNEKAPATLKVMPTPKHVWQCLNMDYLGPLPNRSYVLVVLDQCSRFPEVEFVTSRSANQLIPCLERMFSTYGIPETIVTGNGPPFKSSQLKEYMTQNGIKHRRITPLWPQANAEAERFMKPLTNIIQTAFIEKKSWKSEVYKFLFAYRSTPHSTTNIAPSELMFNRKIKYVIPNFDYQPSEDLVEKMEEND